MSVFVASQGCLFSNPSTNVCSLTYMTVFNRVSSQAVACTKTSKVCGQIGTLNVYSHRYRNGQILLCEVELAGPTASCCKEADGE